MSNFTSNSVLYWRFYQCNTYPYIYIYKMYIIYIYKMYIINMYLFMDVMIMQDIKGMYTQVHAHTKTNKQA